MAERRLGIVRKFSLAEAAEGWTADCFVAYRPAAIAELAEMKGLDPAAMAEDKAASFMISFIKGHVLYGKVMLLQDDGQLRPGDLEVDDIDTLPPDTVKDLFIAVSGAGLDPKDIPPAVPDAGQPPSDANSTATSSSAD